MGLSGAGSCSAPGTASHASAVPTVPSTVPSTTSRTLPVFPGQLCRVRARGPPPPLGQPSPAQTRKGAVPGVTSCAGPAYHELGDLPLLDAGRSDLEEQLDRLPAALLVPPVVLQLPRGHAGVGARAAVGVCKGGSLEDRHRVGALAGRGPGDMAGSGWDIGSR